MEAGRWGWFKSPLELSNFSRLVNQVLWWILIDCSAQKNGAENIQISPNLGTNTWEIKGILNIKKNNGDNDKASF